MSEESFVLQATAHHAHATFYFTTAVPSRLCLPSAAPSMEMDLSVWPEILLASVQPSDCRCGLVPTFLLASAETPASAGLGLHGKFTEWTAEFGSHRPDKTEQVQRDAAGWGFTFLWWDLSCLNEEIKHNLENIVTVYVDETPNILSSGLFSVQVMLFKALQFTQEHILKCLSNHRSW